MSQNMGDLETFDPSQAALGWLETKSRRERLPEKAKQQDGFWAFIKKPPLSKNKKDLNKQIKIKGM